MLNRPSLLIVGAGRVGKTLGHLLVKQDLVDVSAVCNTTISSAQQACQFIGAGRAADRLADCPSCDLILLTPPDDALKSVIANLFKHGVVTPNTALLHCSGCYTANDLVSSNPVSHRIASIHPVMSFAAAEIAVDSFEQVPCAYEGSVAALEQWLPLFKAIGADCFPIQSHNKAAYHAGLVCASNYAVALLDAAQAMLQQAGLPVDLASRLSDQLMQQSIANAKRLSCTRTALTGPIKRGDIETIVQHQRVLDDDLVSFYQALGRYTLTMTNHNQALQQQLVDVLSESVLSSG